MQAFGIIGGVKFGGFGATWLEFRIELLIRIRRAGAYLTTLRRVFV